MDEPTIFILEEWYPPISDADLADGMFRWARESRKADIRLNDDRLVEMDDENEYPR